MKRIPIVLVVEDMPVHRLMIRKALEARGITVRDVEDGQQGLDYVFGRGKYADREAYPEPDLVLLDLKMPVIDGYGFLAGVQNEKLSPAFPIIVLTTSARSEEIDRAHAMGATSYLIKPLTFDRLAEKMRALHMFWFETAQLPSKET